MTGQKRKKCFVRRKMPLLPAFENHHNKGEPRRRGVETAEGSGIVGGPSDRNDDKRGNRDDKS